MILFCINVLKSDIEGLGQWDVLFLEKARLCLLGKIGDKVIDVLVITEDCFTVEGLCEKYKLWY